VIDIVENFDEIESVTQALRSGNTWLVWVWLGTALACSSVGLVGALRYNQRLTQIAVAWFSVTFLMHLLALSGLAILISGIYVYAHVYFYQDCKKGIMTKENYPAEKYCCFPFLNNML
jgi:hypothetical protein